MTVNGVFLLRSPLPDISVKEIFSGVVPSERARTHDSEYVGHIGVQRIKSIVIPDQGQGRSAKVGLSRKIGDVPKKKNAYFFKKLIPIPY